jgi:hypothetical protein
MWCDYFEAIEQTGVERQAQILPLVGFDIYKLKVKQITRLLRFDLERAGQLDTSDHSKI